MMLVRRFLDRLAMSEPSQRAEIVRALVRVYLEVPLDAENRSAAATALLAVLDDPAPRVRRAMAEALASSPDAPRPLIRGLAEDLPDISTIVLRRSPLLSEVELVDYAGGGCERKRVAIASRDDVGVGLAAALIEVSGPEACLALLANPRAAITASSLGRLVERHGSSARIREALLARPDLPATLRQRLIDGLAQVLADLVIARDWLSPQQANRVIADARDRAVVDLAASCRDTHRRRLIEMLAVEGRLTATLMIRALATGHRGFVEDALSHLARTPVSRVVALMQDNGAGFCALYRKSGLAPAALPVIRAMIEVLRDQTDDGTELGRARMGRTMLERVLTALGHDSFTPAEIDEFAALLWRLATDAAREEARMQSGGYFQAA